MRPSDGRSISTGKNVDNDFDYDLLSAGYPEAQEEHGLLGRPVYVAEAGFNAGTKQGRFQLTRTSPGCDQGVLIPNFCDVFTGRAPDMGAHEAGTAPMTFGVEARFVPAGVKAKEASQ